ALCHLRAIPSSWPTLGRPAWTAVTGGLFPEPISWGGPWLFTSPYGALKRTKPAHPMINSFLRDKCWSTFFSWPVGTARSGLCVESRNLEPGSGLGVQRKDRKKRFHEEAGKEEGN